MLKSIAKFFKSEPKVYAPVELSDFEKKACEMFTVDAYVDYVVGLEFENKKDLPTNIQCLEHIDSYLYNVEKEKYERKLYDEKFNFKVWYDIDRSEYVKWAVESYKIAKTEFTEINTELDTLLLKCVEGALRGVDFVHLYNSALFTIKEDIVNLTKIEYDKVDSEVFRKFCLAVLTLKSKFKDNEILVLPEFYSVTRNCFKYDGTQLNGRHVTDYIFCLYYKGKKYFVTSMELQKDSNVVYKRTESRGCNW